MTVAAKVKQTVASLKGAEASLYQFYLHEKNPLYLEGVSIIRSIVEELEQRVSKLEFEEPQYKGF